MSAGLWQRLDLLARGAAPLALTLMLVLAHVTPLRLPAYSHVAPDFALMAVYYWAVHRPDLLPFSAVFVVGLLNDLLTGGPLGLYAFIYLICRWQVMHQRRLLVGKGFGVLWFGFAVMAVLEVGLAWLGASLLRLGIMPAEPAAFQGLLTVAAFPLIAWLFIQVHRHVLRPG